MRYLFKLDSAESLTLTDSQIYDNAGIALYSSKMANGGTISNCKFNNNGKAFGLESLYFEEETDITFENCDLGNSTFKDKQNATFTNCTGAGIGSLFSAKSTSVLIAVGALIEVFAGASVVVMKKRRAAEAK